METHIYPAEHILSILFMRFTLLVNHVHKFFSFPFNSLYEIHKKPTVAELGRIYQYAFNSLYEILRLFLSGICVLLGVVFQFSL